MTLFKKKKHTLPALYFSLDKELEHAKIKKEQYFYYPLEEHEVDKARAWGIRNGIIIQPSHLTDNTIWYKFFGF